jgi:hypothetical protein
MSAKRSAICQIMSSQDKLDLIVGAPERAAWQQIIIGMTYLIEFGRFLSCCYLAERAVGEASQKTTAASSTRSCGICALVPPWRDLPPDYGDWKNTHRRFCRWRDKGHWKRLLAKLMQEPDFEWLMIDTSHVKAHSHAAGAVGGNKAIGLTKGGATPRYIWPWMRMVCRCESLLQQVPWQIARRLQS